MQVLSDEKWMNVEEEYSQMSLTISEGNKYRHLIRMFSSF